ncbi:ABC transporter ATP-binding protein [Bradyrhizobium sp.]|uniref:ABC transporter ATP-binding protein n=1 Tax=Bradyrhizobium sp. TaxID=376 RepID=UPI00403817E4
MLQSKSDPQRSVMPTPASEPVCIEARNLSKTFQVRGGSITAVSDVSFAVRKGEFVSLLGPSGSGKSTVLNMIATLLEPTHGSILIDREVQNSVANPKVGYMFQRDTLFPWRTVGGNIGYALEAAGVGADERRKRVSECVRQAGLIGFEELYPAALSGGMRQRAQLMRTLIRQPEVLLMDEPFGALDTHTKLDMHRVLLDIWERERQTVLFVTHDLSEALTLSDRIILFAARPGRIKATFEVKFPRPRDGVSLRETEDYSQLFSKIWHSLGEEFRKAKAE